MTGLALSLAPSPTCAEVLYELEWGQVVELTGERPRVQVLTCDSGARPSDCAVVVTYFNVLTSQAELEIEIATPVGPISVHVDPRKGRVTDILTVVPPPGYVADPNEIDVGEGQVGAIVIRPMVLGADEGVHERELVAPSALPDGVRSAVRGQVRPALL